MSTDVVDVGTAANDGTGDALRDAFIALNLILQKADTSTPAKINVFEDVDTGTNKVTITCASALGGDYTMTLASGDLDLEVIRGFAFAAAGAGASQFEMYEPTGAGTEKCTVKAAATMAGDITLTLPSETLDMQTQKAKVDGVEALADVTDETNVLAALATGATAKDQGGGAITNVGAVDGRTLSTDGAKLDLIEALADVTDAANVDSAGAVMETDYDAQSVMVAVADDTPLKQTVGDSEFVGRFTGGDVGVVTVAQANTMLGTENWTEITHQTTTGVQGNAGTVALSDDTTYLVEVRAVGRKTDGSLHYGYKRTAVVYRTGGGFATQAAGSPNADVDIDGGTATDVDVTVSGADSNVQFAVTGLPATVIDWKLRYRLISLA